MIDESTVRQLLSEHKTEIAADFDTRLDKLKDEMLAAFKTRQDDYSKRLDALQKSYEDRWTAQQTFNESTNTSLNQNTAALSTQGQTVRALTERTGLLGDVIEHYSELYTQIMDTLRENTATQNDSRRRVDAISMEVQDIVIRMGQMQNAGEIQKNMIENVRDQQNAFIRAQNQMQVDLATVQHDLHEIAEAVRKWKERVRNTVNFMLDRRGFAITVAGSMLLAQAFGWVAWEDIADFISILFGMN